MPLFVLGLLAWWFPTLGEIAPSHATSLDLAKATIVIRSGPLPAAESTAARVLHEEILKRTGLDWPIQTQWPKRGVAIAIASGSLHSNWPPTQGTGLTLPTPPTKAEGFQLSVHPDLKPAPGIWILGADGRGALFGVGQLLREIHWQPGKASLPASLRMESSPALPIRGHQLGYRHTANSWDGWDERQFEQYIRELALFGANSVEGIPFQDTRKSPHMKIPRAVMNRRFSELCAQYDLDYWVWCPAEFDLKDPAKRAEHLAHHVDFFKECPRLDALFFPGGDPGNNPPDVVLEFLAELSRPLRQYHPKAKLWLSMQGFDAKDTEYVHHWIEQTLPDWMGGLVAGPSSPPLQETRARLPKQYGLRDYPDITHTVRCQFPVPWWDPAFHFTLGREPVNPRPVYYKAVQDLYGPYTSGFITYSDGVHDDVNKAVWSRLGWQPEATARQIVLEYTRCFFGEIVAEEAADGILALERNWEGSIQENGAIESTLALWQRLERDNPRLKSNWRWQLCLLRAYYDASVRQRAIHETATESRANRVLEQAPRLGSLAALDQATAILQQPDTSPQANARQGRIRSLCAELYQSIHLQTSVPLHQASGYERGAVLDFLDHPLNNRWWLTDEFKRIRSMPTESDRLQAIHRICTWENPGPGSFYDEVGHIGKSPRVVRGEGIHTDPLMERNPNPGFWWWDEGSSRARLSWQSSMDWPLGLKYRHLDPKASYRVRLTGFGQPKPRANGQALTPVKPMRIGIGETQEFQIPPGVIQTETLVITFDPLPEEAALNWRQQSRVSEVWLIRD